MIRDLTDAMQDYLKEIYKLRLEGAKATTSAIAERMGVTASLGDGDGEAADRAGLAEHTPYRGVELTPSGERVALEVIRHHRLLEQYLTQALGLSLDEVHSEADRLEHALSEELEARIDQSLGFPTHDPHGDPIPDAPPADQAARGCERSPASSPAMRPRSVESRTATRRCCATWRSSTLVPGKKVKLHRAEPFGGPLTVRVGKAEHAISRELAAGIGVA